MKEKREVKEQATMGMELTSYLSIALLISLTSPFFFTSDRFVIADHTHFNNDAVSQPPPQNRNSALTSELEVIKLELQKLEHLLAMTELELTTKDAYISKQQTQIEELNQNIRQLESNLSYVEDPPNYEKVINAFEVEVQELEAGVRSNDREIQKLKHRAKDSENRVDLLASQVKTMATIIPELWFHVQKLEQAKEVIERRTAELRRHIRNQKCSFFKFMHNFGGRQYHAMVAPYTSEGLNLLKMSLSAFKKYHHQLQGVVKREMDKHELTAVLAGEESVFFLASIIFVFPIMLAWIWLPSRWS